MYVCSILHLGIDPCIFAIAIFLYACSKTNSINLNNNFTKKFQ